MSPLWWSFGFATDLRHPESMRYTALDSANCAKKARLATVTALFPRTANFVSTL
jgi:hypothetical protein